MRRWHSRLSGRASTCPIAKPARAPTFHISLSLACAVPVPPGTKMETEGDCTEALVASRGLITALNAKDELAKLLLCAGKAAPE